MEGDPEAVLRAAEAHAREAVSAAARLAASSGGVAALWKLPLEGSTSSRP